MEFLGQPVAGRFDEKLVDQRTIYDGFEALYTRAEIRNPRSAVHCMLLSPEFEIEIEEWGASLSDEFKGILESHWRDSLVQIDDWLMVAGIAPYTWIRVPKTDHYYPRVMQYTEGSITVAKGKNKGEYEYRWYDSETTKFEADSDVHFLTSSDAPLANGRIRAPLVSLLPDYRILVASEDAAYTVMSDNAKPKYLFEQQQRNTTMDEYSSVVANYGEAMAGFVIEDTERLRSIPERVRKDEMQGALLDAHRHNFRRSVLTKTSTAAEQNAQEGYSIAERSFVVPPNWKYVRGETGKIAVNHMDQSKKLERAAWTCFGYPEDFANPNSRQTSSQYHGSNKFLVERARDKLEKAISVLAQLFQESYGVLIMARQYMPLHSRPTYLVPGKGSVALADSKQLVPRKKRSKPARVKLRQISIQQRIVIAKNVTIKVSAHASPSIGYEALRRLRLDKVITHEQFQGMALSSMGLSKLELKEDKKALLLEEKKFELEEKKLKVMQTKRKREEGVSVGGKKVVDKKDKQKNEKKPDEDSLPPKKKHKARLNKQMEKREKMDIENTE